MSTASAATVASTLEKAEGELRGMALNMEREISSLVRAFEGLAGDTDSVLNLAAAIVGCVENENISSVLPKVQALGAAAKSFIGERLQATTGILDTVGTEVNLLRQLSQLTVGQESIALETKALSVLTNVEAARLGSAGAGFQFLARELADFSGALAQDTHELASQTEGRRAAIEETKAALSAELPGLREKLTRVEIELGKVLAILDSSLTELSSLPVGFRMSIERTAQQIAGVVAAVQSHDITRQQIEHVVEAFTLIAMRMTGNGESGNGVDRELPCAYAGLTIQIYQLKSIKQILNGWITQFKTCMGEILKVSASEVVGIGPLVLEQEREVSSNLAHIELLERESQSYGMKIQRTLGGLSNLMQLIGEHREKSKAVRHRLRLLSFNSIIEASRLGAQAGAILAIARSIKEISAAWSGIADQSGDAMQQIQNLANQTDEVMEAFSEAGAETLRGAQAQTVTSLGNLRNAAAFAARQGQEMKAATEKMQSKSADLSEIGNQLDACFGCVDTVLNEIEPLRRQLEIDYPYVKDQYDAVEVEKLFSASYTTEIERKVLNAALRGTPLPVAQEAFAGNSVELF
jgi:hypothetical protein